MKRSFGFCTMLVGLRVLTCSHRRWSMHGKKRSFQHSWLVQFPWLCYSETRDGGYCVNCVLFAKHNLPLGQLVTSAMTNFTRATVAFKEHDTQTTHKIATKVMVDFLNHMEKVHCQLHSSYKYSQVPKS